MYTTFDINTVQLTDRLKDIKICLKMAKREGKFSKDALEEGLIELEKLISEIESNHSTDESL